VVVLFGLTIMVGEVELLLHEYVPPSVAVSVADCPWQMLLLPEMVIDGGWFTFTVATTTLSHHATADTQQLYEVVVVGETVIEGDVCPVFQE
jgi:hypothetical protein